MFQLGVRKVRVGMGVFTSLILHSFIGLVMKNMIVLNIIQIYIIWKLSATLCHPWHSAIPMPWEGVVTAGAETRCFPQWHMLLAVHKLSPSTSASPGGFLDSDSQCIPHHHHFVNEEEWLTFTQRPSSGLAITTGRDFLWEWNWSSSKSCSGL